MYSYQLNVLFRCALLATMTDNDNGLGIGGTVANLAVSIMWSN